MSFSSHTSEVTPEVVRAMRAAIKVTGVAKLFAANITADGPAETPRQVRPGPARPALRGLRLPRKGYGAAQRLPAFFKPRPLQRHHHRSRRRLRPQGPEPGATSCCQGEEAWTPWSRSRRPSTPSGPADPRGPAGPLLQRGERRLARWQRARLPGVLHHLSPTSCTRSSPAVRPAAPRAVDLHCSMGAPRAAASIAGPVHHQGVHIPPQGPWRHRLRAAPCRTFGSPELATAHAGPSAAANASAALPTGLQAYMQSLHQLR